MAHLELVALILVSLRIVLSDIYFRTISNWDLIFLSGVLIFSRWYEVGALIALALLVFGPVVARLFGAGDVKLLAVLSIGISSIPKELFLILFSLFIGVLWATPNLIRKGGSSDSIPFAPALIFSFIWCSIG